MEKYMYSAHHNYENYAEAFKVAVEKFAAKQPQDIANKSGAAYDDNNKCFYLASLGQELQVSYPDGEVCFKGTEINPIFPWRLVAVNYLARAKGTELTGKLISYRELEDGNVFFQAYRREVIQPFSQLVEKEDPDLVCKTAAFFGTVSDQEEKGDLVVFLKGFPRFPIRLNIWFADEELGGSVNLLYDERASDYLHTEDVAVLAQMFKDFFEKEIS